MYNNSVNVELGTWVVDNPGLKVWYGKNGQVDYGHNVGLHLDDVYGALVQSALAMEDRVRVSLENYTKHPDVQANLQQLQYDLQSWNLALTTMTNMQKNMADALKSIVGNLR